MANIRKSGNRWRAVVRKRGFDRLDPSYKGRKSIGRTFRLKGDAEKWAKETEDRVDKLNAGLIMDGDALTLANAVDQYTERFLGEDSTKVRSATSRGNYRHYLAYWVSELGDMKLTEIKPMQIERCLDQLAAKGNQFGAKQRLERTEAAARKQAPNGKLKAEQLQAIRSRCKARPLSPQSVQHYLIGLSSLYSTAIKPFRWITPASNPIPAVVKPTVENERQRYLTEDEAHRLIAACRESGSEHLYPLLMLCLTTGCRRGEALSLRWEHINWKAGTALLRNTKNKDDREIALLDSVKPLLAQLRDRGGYSRRTGLVFCRNGGSAIPGLVQHEKPVNVRQSFYRACRVAGIEDFRWHDLRHSAASFLAADGCNLLEIGAVLGHRSVSSTRRYAHLADGAKHQLVHRTMGKLLGGADNE